MIPPDAKPPEDQQPEDYVAPESPIPTPDQQSDQDQDEPGPEETMKPEEVPVPESEDGDRKRDHEAVSQSPSDWEPLPVSKKSRLELLEVYYQEIANRSAQRQRKGKEATFKEFLGKD